MLFLTIYCVYITEELAKARAYRLKRKADEEAEEEDERQRARTLRAKRIAEDEAGQEEERCKRCKAALKLKEEFEIRAHSVENRKANEKKRLKRELTFVIANRWMMNYT